MEWRKKMTEYIYKGFKVHYLIKQDKKEPSSYNAKGSVICYIKGDGPTLSQKFQTEGPSKNFVQNEIKKMINSYIEFEWKQYIEMQGNI